jgi:hypothetical protein
MFFGAARADTAIDAKNKDAMVNVRKTFMLNLLLSVIENQMV